MMNNGSYRLWQPLALAGALAFVYATVLAKLSNDWWHDENYSHGLLVPFVMAYLLWEERDFFRRTAKKPSAWAGGALVLGALLLLWLGVAGAELYLQRLSLIMMLAGVTIYFWGGALLRWVAMPLFLLWLALPIPAIIFNKIAFPLQLFASRCAVSAMQGLNIPVVREGNVIELLPLGSLTTKKLEVAEACSGIRSLMALVTLAAVLAYLSRPGRGDGSNGEGGWRETLTDFGFWRGVFIVASAVPIAILTNAMRVSGTGILARYYGTKVAEGFFHSFSGWVVYVAAFALLGAVTWIFDRLTRKRQSAAKIKPASVPAEAVN
jgi:exosortase